MMTPVYPRLLNMINDFVLLRFWARAPEDLGAMEVILYYYIIHSQVSLTGIIEPLRSLIKYALCAPSLPTSLTSCLLWWMSSTPSSPAAWITASSRHWLTRSTCSTAICFTFAKFAGWVEEPWCPVCATCRRRSPPFFVRRIWGLSSLCWSVLRPAMARSPSPADRHHYAPERPQREATGQTFS